MRECGGVGDLLGWISLRMVPLWFGWRLSRRTLELSRGSKPFAKRQPKQHKTLGCGVNRPGESGDYGIVGEGLETYRDQGWAAISAWSWVVL